MFEKILVMTDLSESSGELMRRLDGLRKLGTNKALLVRCVNLRELDVLGRDYMNNSEDLLIRQAEILRSHGFEVQHKITVGAARHEVNRLSEEHQCSLIVVGERKHSLLGEMLFEEFAGAVTHSSAKPVLVMRLHGEGTEEESDFQVENDLLRHVLLPTDFSETADQALGSMESLAGAGIRKATIMHVHSMFYYQSAEVEHLTIEQFLRNDEKQLQHRKERLQAASIPEIETELKQGGSPKNEILQRIEKGDISLVIAGTQGHGYIGELLLGGVGYSIARHSEVPTLLVPPRKESQ